MRKILLAGLLAATLAPGLALAGGVVEPTFDPLVPLSSSHGLLVPLLLLLVIGAAVGG